MANFIRNFKENMHGKVSNFSISKYVRQDPVTAAALGKGHRGRNAISMSPSGDRVSPQMSSYLFQTSLVKRARSNSDAKAMLRLLPDLELGAQILVSSILSPKDFTSVDLIYQDNSELFTDKLGSSLIQVLDDFFSKNYQIKNHIYTMIYEALIEKGSYPVAVLPENVLDDMINGHMAISKEAFRELYDEDTVRGLIPKNCGILGSPRHNTLSKKMGVAIENLSLSSADVSKIDKNLQYYDPEGKVLPWKNYTSEEYILVTDNISALKAPFINRIIKNDLTKKKTNQFSKSSKLRKIGMEALQLASSDVTNVSDSQIQNAIFRSNVSSPETVATVAHQFELKRKTIGNPLVLKLPSESVLPVYAPGEPANHIGYYVVLDEEGNPIHSNSSDILHPGEISNTSGMSSDLTNNLMTKIGANFDVIDSRNDHTHIQRTKMMVDAWADLVERDLITRAKNGVTASTVSIAQNEQLYRLMLSRVLAKKYTQILFIPAEYMTYFAFKHGDDGIGRSLLDDTHMVNVLRCIMMFTDVLAGVKNSIGRKKVKVNLDEDDPNPMKTAEQLVDEIVRTNSVSLPGNISSPADVMEFIQRHGFMFTFEGNERMPKMEVDFEHTSSSIPKSDSDLNDRLKKASISGLGLPPELVESGFNGEFATNTLTNNILLTKRVINHQDKFNPFLAKHLRQVAQSTQSVREELLELIKANQKDLVLKFEDLIEYKTSGAKLSQSEKEHILAVRCLNGFLEQFTVSLPKPSSVTIESQASELSKYSSAVDAALDAYVSTDLFGESLVGKLSESVGTIRSQIKALVLRKWMKDKGFMTEIPETLVGVEDETASGSETANEINEHMLTISKMAIELMAKGAKNAASTNSDIDKAGITIGSSEGSYSSGTPSYSSGSSGGGDLGGFSMGGDDDLGLGDLGLDDSGSSSTDEGAPESTPNTTPDSEPDIPTGI